MVSATLMMVLMTTVVLGGIMSAFAKIIGLDKEGEEDEKEDGTHDSKLSRMTDIVMRNKQKGWLQRKLNLLDDKVLKPLFGGDLSKVKRHKQERKVEKERRTMMNLSGLSGSNGRSTENVTGKGQQVYLNIIL